MEHVWENLPINCKWAVFMQPLLVIFTQMQTRNLQQRLRNVAGNVDVQ